jgi:hypothetical protein
VNRKDRVKILDFALATSAVSEESEIQATLSCAPDLMTRPGTILGTMGIWVIAVVGVAPCKCFSPGGNQSMSPGRISSIGPPQRCARPQPAVIMMV